MFGEKLKELRTEKNITQKEIAKILGCNQSMLTRWENNENEPTYSFLIKIADFFQCSIDYLVGREDDFGNIETNADLDYREKKLLENFKFLEPDEKDKIIEDCEYFAKKKTAYKNKKNA